MKTSDTTCDRCGGLILRVTNYRAEGEPAFRLCFFAGLTTPLAEMDVCRECSDTIRALFPHAPKDE